MVVRFLSTKLPLSNSLSISVNVREISYVDEGDDETTEIESVSMHMLVKRVTYSGIGGRLTMDLGALQPLG